MTSNTSQLLVFFLLTTTVAIAFLSAAATASNSTSSHPHHLQNLLVQLAQWREHQLEPSRGTAHGLSLSLSTAVAWVLSFLAASVSSAGGVGGGSLFVPILNLVAGLSLKRSTAYSSFMVTGGAVSNVLYHILCEGGGHAGQPPLISYDIALLFQPCLLLGVSIGVVCNVMFPEWLITALFALFLASCTVKTCKSGVRIWRSEGVEATRRTRFDRNEPLLLSRGSEGDEGRHGGEGDKGSCGNGGPVVPWKDVAVLVMVWLCFFVLHVLIGDKHGKGLIRIKPCGVAYWLINASQVPFAVAFTIYIIFAKRKKQAVYKEEDGQANLIKDKMETLPVLVLPTVAFVTGVLSGLFGIGGGLLANPVLLQIGINPQTATATSSFMVLFCASMSMVQFILVGMNGIGEALVYAGVCFVASVVGLVVIGGAVKKSGRVSLIVFVVTAVMALSTVVITCFGAIDVWKQYTNGEYMGFKSPC